MDLHAARGRLNESLAEIDDLHATVKELRETLTEGQMTAALGGAAYDPAPLRRHIENAQLRISELELLVTKLRPAVETLESEERQRISAERRERLRTAGPIADALLASRLAEIEQALPALAAVLAVTLGEPARLYAEHPRRVLSWVSHKIQTGADRAAFTTAVTEAYNQLADTLEVK
jgi:hypothetical protein